MITIARETAAGSTVEANRRDRGPEPPDGRSLSSGSGSPGGQVRPLSFRHAVTHRSLGRSNPRRPGLIGLGIPLWLVVTAGAVGIPTDDDWVYMRGAENLFHTGALDMPGHTAASIGQIFMVQPLLWLSGGDRWAFTVFGLVLGLLGLASTYLLSRQFVGMGTAALVVLVLEAFPGFGRATASFMTDVPAFSLSMVCLLLGVRWLHGRGSPVILIASVAAGLLAVSIREFSIAAPASILMAAWVRNRGGGRPLLAALSVGFFGGVAAILLVAASLPGHGVPVAADSLASGPHWAGVHDLRRGTAPGNRDRRGASIACSYRFAGHRGRRFRGAGPHPPLRRLPGEPLDGERTRWQRASCWCSGARHRLSGVGVLGTAGLAGRHPPRSLGRVMAPTQLRWRTFADLGHQAGDPDHSFQARAAASVPHRVLGIASHLRDDWRELRPVPVPSRADRRDPAHWRVTGAGCAGPQPCICARCPRLARRIRVRHRRQLDGLRRGALESGRGRGVDGLRGGHGRCWLRVGWLSRERGGKMPTPTMESPGTTTGSCPQDHARWLRTPR